MDIEHRATAREALVAAFPGCEQGRVDAALSQLSLRSLGAGDILIQADETGRCAYLLLRGVLQVYGHDPDQRLVPIARLETPGRLFGEQALLPGRRHRNASVTALQQSQVAELPIEAFQVLLEGDPQTRERLQRQGLSELRDHAQLVLAEAVLFSFGESGVRLSDHHEVGHEFLEFWRAEQKKGREPQAERSWVVPPMSGSLNVLYQEPFENQALKPAYLPQDPVWMNKRDRNAERGVQRCPFSG